MALLEILCFPDSRLRTRATLVARVDQSVRALIRDMFETMYLAPGIGLAATQVNVHKQIIVIDISENRQAPVVLINPELLFSEGELEYEEGCLSVPGFFDKVARPAHVRVRTLDEQGQTQELEAEGLLATCIQHEMDHLQGKLFVDYLSSLKRERIRKKLEKQSKIAL